MSSSTCKTHRKGEKENKSSHPRKNMKTSARSQALSRKSKVAMIKIDSSDDDQGHPQQYEQETKPSGEPSNRGKAIATARLEARDQPALRTLATVIKRT